MEKCLFTQAYIKLIKWKISIYILFSIFTYESNVSLEKLDKTRKTNLKKKIRTYNNHLVIFLYVPILVLVHQRKTYLMQSTWKVLEAVKLWDLDLKHILELFFTWRSF